MVEVEQQQTESSESLTDEEALMKIAQAMKDNAPSQDEKQNVHTLLNNIILTKDTTKCGNLQVDKITNELGIPNHNVRGSKELALISGKIMNNKYFEDYFKQEAEDTLATSLSREGFLVRTSVSQTKSIIDSTKRRKYNSGLFKKKIVEESGGDPYQNNSS
jgi:hypothetical protein